MFQPTTRQAVLAAFVPAIVLMGAGLAIGSTIGSVLLGAGIGSIGLGALQRRTGLDLDPQGLVIRGIGRSELIRWSDITDMTVSERGSRSALQIETQARFYRPNAPFSSRFLPDPDFGDKVRGITEAWRQRRDL